MLNATDAKLLTKFGDIYRDLEQGIFDAIINGEYEITVTINSVPMAIKTRLKSLGYSCEYFGSKHYKISWSAPK